MTTIRKNNGQTVASKVRIAANIFQRFKGLLGTSSLSNEEGLWIPKCQGIHTFGMRYSLDIVFLDHRFHILKIIEDMKPGRMSDVRLDACGVLELPAGKVKKSRLHVGDQLLLQKEEAANLDDTGSLLR